MQGVLLLLLLLWLLLRFGVVFMLLIVWLLVLGPMWRRRRCVVGRSHCYISCGIGSHRQQTQRVDVGHVANRGELSGDVRRIFVRKAGDLSWLGWTQRAGKGERSVPRLPKLGDPLLSNSQPMASQKLHSFLALGTWRYLLPYLASCHPTSDIQHPTLPVNCFLHVLIQVS